MAQLDRRLPSNVDGAFFVDDSCIDCGTCYWMAPTTFAREGSMSRVYQQPEDAKPSRRAELALLACPTSSIGCDSGRDLAPAVAAIPDLIEGSVYHCGYHSEKSFGAASYLVRRPEGNVLVDSPRFTRPLVRRLEEWGGLSLIFLSHCDDVADSRKYAEHFGCDRVLHLDDVGDSTRDVEIQIEGVEPVALDDALLVLPVPGHTRGSSCLLYDGRFLFSGDHVAWNARLEQVYAFRSACWYDWEIQIESMRRLAEHDFAWILPGHGAPCHFDVSAMRHEMQRCIEWMQAR
ncbi:MAG TPA: MBL fold metallo-hydrolase [Candidatus Krumholzibacteria bacterium]|jgi:glyoxylase-like metal-dependent hydrolase (beta-lactamase superfamily II)/ferredoxin